MKSGINFVKFEEERELLEEDMNRLTKYPHIFKAEEIAVKMKADRENMLRDVDSLNKRKISSFRNHFIDGGRSDVFANSGSRKRRYSGMRSVTNSVDVTSYTHQGGQPIMNQTLGSHLAEEVNYKLGSKNPNMTYQKQSGNPKH